MKTALVFNDEQTLVLMIWAESKGIKIDDPIILHDGLVQLIVRVAESQTFKMGGIEFEPKK